MHVKHRFYAVLLGLAIAGGLIAHLGANRRWSRRQVDARSQRDKWTQHGSSGFPVWIARNSATEYVRTLYVLVDAKHFTEEQLATVFKSLSAVCGSQPEHLWIHAFTDEGTLTRALEPRQVAISQTGAATSRSEQTSTNDDVITGSGRAGKLFGSAAEDYAILNGTGGIAHYNRAANWESFYYSLGPTEPYFIVDLKPRTIRYTGDLDSDLVLAVRNGDGNKVTSLIAEGADVNERDKYGDTPLLMAALGRDLDTVRLLLQKHARPEIANSVGLTALMAASSNGDNAVVGQLLSKGASVDHKAVNGTTALMLASVNGYAETVRLLLARGASPDLRDEKGRTALMEAARGEDITLRRDRAAAIELLLAKGADVNATDSAGQTALMLAGDDKERIRLLLAHGADVNAKDNRGYTALMHAARWYRVLKVRMLLDGGADVNAQNASGQTALRVARSVNDNGEIVEMLRQAGARE